MFLNGKILFENLVKDKQILMVTNSFNRYIWLVDLIYRTGKISFEEINHKWIISPMSGGNPLPLRTFHNHRKAIERLFDINIGCDKQTYKYYIENIDDIKNAGVRTWLLNTFAVNNLINETQKIKHRIVFENIPSGQHFLAPIIESMRDGLTIEITYQSYWKDEPRTFEIESYFVKIFKQRWYVIGRSTYDDRIRIYALDRIQFMISTKTQFDLPKDFNPEDYFINCFGIIADETVPVQKVFIKALGSKVKYLRSLPLHQSQQEIVTTDNYSIFQYFIRPTYDFRQELISLGEEIEVLAPDTFRKELHDIAYGMLNHYKS